ncbi:MAG: hypothetical protein ACYTDU_20885 [Planctomycetota bacterium]
MRSTWFLVLLAATATGQEWLKKTYARDPPAQVIRSERGSLRWIGLLGEARLRHGGPIYDCAIGKRRLVTVGGDRTLRVMDLESRRTIRVIDTDERPYAIAVESGGPRIVVGTETGKLRIWDGDTGKLVRTIDAHQAAVNDVDIGPGSTWVVSGGADRLASVWDLSTGKELRTLARHPEGVRAVAVSPDGRRIATAAGTSAFLFDAATGEFVHRFDGQSVFTSVAFSPDGSVIVTAAMRRPRLWNAHSGAEIRTLGKAEREPGPLRTIQLPILALSVAFSPDGRRVVSGTMSGKVYVWDRATGNQVRVIEAHHFGPSAATYTGDGSSIVSWSQSVVRVWDAADGRCVFPVDVFPVDGHTDAILALDVDSKKKRIATGSRDTSLRVWDMTTGQTRYVIAGEREVTGVGLAGKWLVSARPVSKGPSLRIRDMSTHRERHAIRAHAKGTTALARSADGKWLATGGRDGTVNVWGAQSGRNVRTLRGHKSRVNAIAFSRDGKRLLSASLDKTVRVWNARSGRLLHVLSGSRGAVNAVAVEPRGKWIIAGGRDKRVRVWSLAGPDRAQEVGQHGDIVYAVAVSPDGRWAYSASLDKTLRVWDAVTWTQADSIRVDGVGSAIVVRGNQLWVGCRSGVVCRYEHVRAKK